MIPGLATRFAFAVALILAAWAIQRLARWCKRRPVHPVLRYSAYGVLTFAWVGTAALGVLALSIAAFMANRRFPAPPSLEAVKVDQIALATTADMVRYDHALEPIARAQFGGVQTTDGKGGLVWEFRPDEYDKYRKHRDRGGPRQPQWPTFRLTLSSRMPLVDEKSTYTQIAFQHCDSDRNFWLPEFVLWRGTLIGGAAARRIRAVMRADATPQTYEVFLPANYRGPNQARHPHEDAVPLEEDLCIALSRYIDHFTSVEGRPLRIPKERINAALTP
jgi:hypothetical protein